MTVIVMYLNINMTGYHESKCIDVCVCMLYTGISLYYLVNNLVCNKNMASLHKS